MMVKTKSEINLMRTAGRIAAEIMEEVIEFIRPGITGLEVNDLVYRRCLESGSKPAFLNYEGYRYAVCLSVNNCIVHCEPSNREFVDGDMIKIDFGVVYKDYCSDMARTIVVGHPTLEQKNIILASTKIFDAVLSFIVPGVRIGDISHLIHRTAMSTGYDIIQDFCSHGIGNKIHEPPQIPHVGVPNKGLFVFSGMTFAIEPIIRSAVGSIKFVDSWCVVSDPPCLSSHYENTILVTDNGSEVLTSC